MTKAILLHVAFSVDNRGKEAQKSWFIVGASVKPGVKIGKGSIVGVGAAVIKDVAPHSVVVGVPAKEVKKNE